MIHDFLHLIRHFGRSLVLCGFLTGALLMAWNADAATPYTTIANPGTPLTDIYLGNELSMQAGHAGDSPDNEVYPPRTIPGDFGTFAVINGTLYSPDIKGHLATAAEQIGAYTAFTPVSQSAVTGKGTTAYPFKVTTTVDAGATGIRIVQTVTYVPGNEYFTTDTVLTNSGATDQPVLLYRAMDCYLGKSDYGYGYATSDTVACTQNRNNSPSGRVEALTSLTSGHNYMETFYGMLWDTIGAHTPFPDTIEATTSIDNAIGLSWSLVVPAGGSVTVSDKTLFAPLGFPASADPTPMPVPTLGQVALLALASLMLGAAGWRQFKRS